MGRRAMWRDLHYVSTQVGCEELSPFRYSAGALDVGSHPTAEIWSG